MKIMEVPLAFYETSAYSVEIGDVIEIAIRSQAVFPQFLEPLHQDMIKDHLAVTLQCVTIDVVFKWSASDGAPRWVLVRHKEPFVV
jgi:hypothetical protein